MFQLNPLITGLEEEGAFAVLERANALKARGHPVINLGIGQPDMAPPAHVLEAARKAIRDGPHGYTSPVGLPVLREAAADHVNRRHGAEIAADQVIIVPGGKVTFYFACLLLGGKGAEILYPDPGFPPYREAICSSGAKAVAYRAHDPRGSGFKADDILTLITPATRLIIVNSPSNPTGGIVARCELEKLADGLRDHPAVAVLSDEIYSHLVFEQADFTSLLAIEHLRERVILLDGWSKTFGMTGWRLGFGVWPRALIEHVRKLITVNHSCVNVAAQMAGLAALTGPMDEIEAFRQELAHRRQFLIDGLNTLPGVQCPVPGGAFYAFPNVEATGHASKRVAHWLLEDAHIAVIAGDSFGANGTGHLRLSYAARKDELECALDRMDTLWRTRIQQIKPDI